MPQNKRKTGSAYENLAAKYLEDNGFKILERNFFCKFGEVDIIAQEDDYLCFIEVKYRKVAGSGNPFEAVDFRKQKKISSVFDYYIMTHPYMNKFQVRFDVVGILNTEISLIRNAFPYIGRM